MIVSKRLSSPTPWVPGIYHKAYCMMGVSVCLYLPPSSPLQVISSFSSAGLSGGGEGALSMRMSWAQEQWGRVLPGSALLDPRRTKCTLLSILKHVSGHYCSHIRAQKSGQG